MARCIGARHRVRCVGRSAGNCGEHALVARTAVPDAPGPVMELQPTLKSESAMPTLWHRVVVLDFVRAGVEERGSMDVVGDSLAELGWFENVDVRSE